MDIIDPVDFMDPEELIDEACEHLLAALASMDKIRRVLRGAEFPCQERLNVVLLRKPKRGPYPRRVE